MWVAGAPCGAPQPLLRKKVERMEWTASYGKLQRLVMADIMGQAAGHIEMPFPGRLRSEARDCNPHSGDVTYRIRLPVRDGLDNYPTSAGKRKTEFPATLRVSDLKATSGPFAVY
ncbi:hypothetical protein FOA52_014507 [Chlamydomonas sp. UWO 241]|nr:hypothetical protein FOA52_014507 [Chlamydomonas sp. UWO 241]